MQTLDRFALIADVHGNSWALDAVLEDIDAAGVETILDGGDSVFGPLDPHGVLERFRARGIRSLTGNQDREMVAPTGATETGESWRHTAAELTPADWEFLRDLPATRRIGDVLLCHGTPTSDTTYLPETIESGRLREATDEELAERLAGVDASLVCCGHTHFPRVILLTDGRTVLNPGSVGLAAYEGEGVPHVMACGSPHARYALIERTRHGWRIEHRAVPYDWQAPADFAARAGRLEWERWLRWGRV